MYIIIIINVIYVAQIRRMQQVRRVDCYRHYSLCHEKCFQTCTEDRQQHVQLYQYLLLYPLLQFIFYFSSFFFSHYMCYVFTIGLLDLFII